MAHGFTLPTSPQLSLRFQSPYPLFHLPVLLSHKLAVPPLSWSISMYMLIICCVVQAQNSWHIQIQGTLSLLHSLDPIITAWRLPSSRTAPHLKSCFGSILFYLREGIIYHYRNFLKSYSWPYHSKPCQSSLVPPPSSLEVPEVRMSLSVDLFYLLLRM